MGAISADIITRIVGYGLTEGNNQESSPNLPIRVAIIAEANSASQSALAAYVPAEITSSAQAAAICGYGSPMHQIAKILFPQSGGGISGIPVVMYPVAQTGVAKVMNIVVTGPATANGTHLIKVAGRTSVEGATYAVNIVNGDTATIIHGKLADALNNVLASPFTGVGTAPNCACTAKWQGLTSQDLTLSIDTQGNDCGLTYAITTATPGSGTPDITATLALFKNNWVTHVINSFGTVTGVMDALEAYNGKPATATSDASGRYTGTIFKPFLAYTGSVADDPSSITDARKTQLTIKISPAPLSKGLPMEAAANDCLLAAVCAANTPHLDTTGKAYPDMPTPADIGSMATWQNRDLFAKKGCSTVDLLDGQYVIQDPVTTYHPTGVVVPAYRYVRNIIIDWNVRYGYLLLEELYVRDHTIAKDNESVAATKVVKPKTWKGVLATYAEDLKDRALIVDVPFMQASTTVALSTTNPDRLASFFKYKRSGYARVLDTTAEAGANFGTLTAN